MPWRNYNQAEKSLVYQVWISEILLQQTQAERVIPFFQKILQKFPNIKALARATYDEFFPYYQGMWYYSRARNILKTAQIITQNFEEIFPKDKVELKKLPGIGEYTSSAILAFWYGKPFLAWDTNLEKFFAGYFLGNRQEKLTIEQKNDINQSFENFIKQLAPSYQKYLIRAINNGLMDFSRMIDSRSIDEKYWENYPIKSGKRFETRGTQEILTQKPKESFPVPDAKIVVILHENHQKYFSQNSDNFEPMILNPSENRNTREYVKDFFRENFHLEVSVRLVHKKWFSQKEEPFVAVNVQIQTGKHNFTEFSKPNAIQFLKKFYEQ